jgi:hypothetical protein
MEGNMKELSLILIVLMISGLVLLNVCQKKDKQTQGTLFARNFSSPEMQFRPKVRWWWPGGDVEKEELIREINLLA